MRLIIEPNDGVGPILSAIKSAKKSVELAVFRFDHKEIESALKAMVGKGVRVTALVAHANRGGEKNLRKLEQRFLTEGIIVARSADDLLRYHDKFILIDRRTLYMLSFNFTHMDIDQSRGFGIVTHNVKWVREAVNLFRADCTRSAFTPSADTFVVSPANSRKVIAAFLRRAKRQLLLYDPKITDKEMLRILQERAKAGVEVRIIGKIPKRAKLGAQKLTTARLHTRTIIRDRHQAFVGSQSLREAELDSRRELGLIVRDSKTVRKLLETFESDWAAGAKKEEQPREQEEVREEASQAAEDKEKKDEAEKEKQEQAEMEKAVETLEKELHPLAASVKKAVRKAVAKAGEEVLLDKDVKETVKKVVKKAVKEAVHEVEEASGH